MFHTEFHTDVSRRAFFKAGALLLTVGSAGQKELFAEALSAKSLKIGLVTDLHYADKSSGGSRYYRQTPEKLAEAAERFQQEKVDFLVELGDFIDAAPDVPTELAYLKTINSQFSKIHADRHHVLGNHCVETLTKEEFLGEVGQAAPHYSFDRNGVHFVVLDACFSSNGKPYGRRTSDWKDTNIPAEEVEWLKSDLQSTQAPTIVFVHQRLDLNNHYAVKNAAEVRSVLEASKKVAAVFQGHSHKNDHKMINDIHYCTLVAMIEGQSPDNNGYSILEISADGTLKLNGYRNQKNYDWTSTASSR